MLWLYTFEYNSTVGQLLADPGKARLHVDGLSGLLASFPSWTNQLLFWLGWILCPALMVRCLLASVCVLRPAPQCRPCLIWTAPSRSALLDCVSL
jgi:hypothetical protein